MGRRRVGTGPQAVTTPWHRWEELHALASEPREQHVLLAEQVEDATNGLFSTLSNSAICSSTTPGKTFQPGGSGSAMWGQGGLPEARGQDPGASQGGRAGKRERDRQPPPWALCCLPVPCPVGFPAGSPELVFMEVERPRA